MLLGFVALYYGAEWLVEGAVSIAAQLNISKVVAGVILVAFGTSAPELFVNCIAAVRGEASFALSNISGSNLANLMIGFGACAVLTQLATQSHKFRTELITFILAPLALFVIMFAMGATVPAWALLILFVGFGYYIYLTSARMHNDEENGDEATLPLARAILWFLLGVGLLYIGGDVTVRQAIAIGEALNISETILGLTVVALGTSIPDITASIVAAREGENEIAVGNLLGSNIFNVLFVIPMTLLVSFLTGKPGLVADMDVVWSYGVVVLFSLGFFVWTSRNDRLTKPVGYAMMGAYFAYMIFRVVQVI